MNATYWANYNGYTFLNTFTNNVGYMYIDLLNIITNSWTSQTYYTYFLAYNIGDLAMRFLYAAPTTVGTVLGVPPVSS